MRLPDRPPDASIAAKLDDLIVELEARAAALVDGAQMPSGGISFGKRVGEGTSIAIERFSDVAMHGQIMQALMTTRAARRRVDDGTYGTCTECGGYIPGARLDVVPAAATCVGCA